MNYLNMQKKITGVFKSYGQSCKVLHQSGSVSYANSVFGTDATADNKNLVSIQSKIIYLSTTKYQIQPGDQLLINRITYYVDVVEDYNQNNVNLAWKIGVLD